MGEGHSVHGLMGEGQTECMGYGSPVTCATKAASRRVGGRVSMHALHFRAGLCSSPQARTCLQRSPQAACTRTAAWQDRAWPRGTSESDHPPECP